MRRWRCSVCGYIHEGDEPPEECPVCGADRTKFEEVTEAPHEGEKSEGLADKPRGTLSGRLVEAMLQNHLHPISVHTPNGIVPAAVLFLVLALALNLASFETAAFYNMVFVLLAMPVVLLSGLIEWQFHYRGARTSVFLTKIACGTVVLVSSAILVAWRFLDPGVAGPGSSARWLFLLLHLVALAAVGLAGNLGGKLVFGRKR